MVKTAAKYKTYAEYKDSGVEWLGEIPNDWEMWKLSHAYTEIGSGTTPSTSNEENFEGNIPWVTTGELRENLILDTKKKVSQRTIEQFPTLKKYPIGSVAIAMYGATIGRLGIFGIEATTNQACCVMTTSKVLNNKYVFYWLQAFKNEIIQLSSGGGQPNINQEKVASLKISAPFFEDQINIANFLDHETTKIDHLIEKQQKLIELLKEKRQAVISHAVTKGLDPNVPMKDSGVVWLGEVPEHWGILPIKYLTESVNTGGTPKNPISFTDADEVNWFTPGDFLNDLEITVSSKYVTFDSVNTGDSKLYPRGSVLMIGIGATLGKIAICNTEFSCNQQINVLVPNRSIISEYLAYALIIQMDQIKQLSNSSTIGIINQEKTKQIVIALPALDEQVKIVEKITQKLLGFKKIIDLSEEQVELLKERRTALISAAVTGKIDVRNWQAPTVAEADTEFSA